MEGIKLWARNGEVVGQALELGELVHIDTASEELTDEFLLPKRLGYAQSIISRVS